MIGFILRFSISLTHSFSSDELSAINRLNYDSLEDMIEFGVKKGDFHPAGVQLFEKFWTSLFETTETFLRFPFVIFGVLSILIIYLIGKSYFTKQAGVIAATLLTVTYFPVLYSELARPYSPGLFFVLLAGWFYLKFFFHDFTKTKYINIVGLGVSLALAMYTHYFAFMLVGFMGVTGLLFIKKQNIVSYLIAGILAFILFFPHSGITSHHLGIEGGLGWLGRPHKLWLFDFLFYVFNDSVKFTAGISLLILYALIYQLKQKKSNTNYRRINLIFILWFFGIYIVAYIFSYVSSPILKYPVMLFPLPFFFLIIGSAFSTIEKNKFNFIFAVILISGLSSTIFGKKLFENKHFGLIKEIAEPMVKWRAKYGQENIVSYLNINNPNYLNYYAIPLGDSLTFDKDVLEYDEDKNIRLELLHDQRPYCIVGYSTRTTLPQVLETCMEFYPFIIEYNQFNNSTIILLSKNKNEGTKLLNKKTIAEINFEKASPLWKFNRNQVRTNYYLSDSSSKFGPSFTFKLSDLESFKTSNWKNYFKISIEAETGDDSGFSATIKANRNNKPVTNNHNQPIWIGKSLESMLTSPKGNTSAYFSFNLPKEIKPNDDITISLWNRNGHPVKIFNIKIELVEDIF